MCLQIKSCHHISCLAWALGTWRLNDFHQGTLFSSFLQQGISLVRLLNNERLQYGEFWTIRELKPSGLWKSALFLRFRDVKQNDNSSSMTYLYRRMRGVGTATKSPCLGTGFSLWSINSQISRIRTRKIMLNTLENRGAFITHTAETQPASWAQPCFWLSSQGLSSETALGGERALLTKSVDVCNEW